MQRFRSVNNMGHEDDASNSIAVARDSRNRIFVIDVNLCGLGIGLKKKRNIIFSEILSRWVVDSSLRDLERGHYPWLRQN